jgi:hypothetical protein
VKGVGIEALHEAAKGKPEGYLDDVLSYVAERRDGFVLFENDDSTMLRDKYSGDVDPMVRGPGTELHRLLGRFGIHMQKGCGCKGRMVQMNKWGPAGCAENFETIIEWLKEEAGKRGLPFFSMPARMLVRRAIANARKEASRGKEAATT